MNSNLQQQISQRSLISKGLLLLLLLTVPLTTAIAQTTETPKIMDKTETTKTDIPTMPASSGLITIKSNHSVVDTADRFESIVKEKGLRFFARIDHSANAQNAELELNPTQVILFGNPKAGTPLMKCAPTTAIDLPQKALFWADDNDDVWLSYNDPEYLKTRHDIKGCDPVLKKISGLLKNLATAATQ